MDIRFTHTQIYQILKKAYLAINVKMYTESNRLIGTLSSIAGTSLVNGDL